MELLLDSSLLILEQLLLELVDFPLFILINVIELALLKVEFTIFVHQGQSVGRSAEGIHRYGWQRLVCIIILVPLVLLCTLLHLLNLLLLQGYLSESRLQLDYRFAFLPHIDDFAPLADCADAPQFDTLLVKENSSLLPILVFQLGQVLYHGIDVDAL